MDCALGVLGVWCWCRAFVGSSWQSWWSLSFRVKTCSGLSDQVQLLDQLPGLGSPSLSSCGHSDRRITRFGFFLRSIWSQNSGLAPTERRIQAKGWQALAVGVTNSFAVYRTAANHFSRASWMVSSHTGLYESRVSGIILIHIPIPSPPFFGTEPKTW